eukprot:scaffold56941_cov24-Phaeocystis_antarctica.AAC.1
MRRCRPPIYLSTAQQALVLSCTAAPISASIPAHSASGRAALRAHDQPPPCRASSDRLRVSSTALCPGVYTLCTPFDAGATTCRPSCSMCLNATSLGHFVSPYSDVDAVALSILRTLCV